MRGTGREGVEHSLFARDCALRSTRVGLSLDDFGTGYSSLSTLPQFLFDTLKIDRAFVGTNGNARRNDEIVQTIANLARVLAWK